MRLMGFESYIKIPNKGFGDLSEGELASMIEAFLEGGNDDFDQSALYEFTHMNYKIKHLEESLHAINEIQDKYKSPHQIDGFLTEEGKKALRSLMKKLRH